MRKILCSGILLGSLIFLMTALVYAQGQDVNTIANQLNSELEKAAVCTPRELNSINKPIKNMLDKGANKENLKNLLADLSKKGVRGKDLKDSIDAMNDLVNSGEKPKEAGNIVSRAAHQAQAQGLKGRELAAKVHEAIRLRKMERQRLKMQMKERKQEQKGKAEESKGESGRMPGRRSQMQGGMGQGKGRK